MDFSEIFFSSNQVILFSMNMQRSYCHTFNENCAAVYCMKATLNTIDFVVSDYCNNSFSYIYKKMLFSTVIRMHLYWSSSPCAEGALLHWFCGRK